ncbi:MULTISPECIES: hypothetical protein [unclassified Streptomyces]|uniref:Uncharacterized protein n=1 Tax=Streptomyces evansiae TaxID=3075535 RepID=A0ABD5EBQ3_9ACTN|nr:MULTISPECIES: hypothetical protein [unclassified Streptomyces]ASY35632.1 hypothetical protein CAC01_25525 [Streptomyces sp. CLI2509]EFK98988.1 predicted protein [Streptomyces sp. SPB78]EGJ78337.1 hypothetical protein STTU_5548 [Streptomyces sp. Tu6071]MDT0412352.1 hypothetical protein [Streptomyces sp. DSM 41979]MDT0418632.1 hypothetical protein [Streptomyces sp. DSM 41982]
MSTQVHSRGEPTAPAAPAQSRLPWWALALPTLAFLVLLALVAQPGEAHAAVASPGLAGLLDRFGAFLGGLVG